MKTPPIITNDFINANWENRWKEVVSGDFDFDSDYLIKVVYNKVNLMLEYFIELKESLDEAGLSTELDNGCEIISVISQLEDVVQLCNKVLNFNYGKEADELFNEYSNESWLSGVSDANYIKWEELTDKAIKSRQKDTEKIFKLIGKNIKNWWV